MSTIAAWLRRQARRYRAGRHRAGDRALSMARLFAILALQHGATTPTAAGQHRLNRDHHQDGPSNAVGAVALAIWAVLLLAMLKIMMAMLVPGA